MLIAEGKIVTLLPLLNPSSKGYGAFELCDFHSYSPSHLTEECWSLKHKIQDLIDQGEPLATNRGEVKVIK